MTRRSRLAVPALLGLGLVPVVGVVGAAPASALSCVGPETVLADAEAVFTGRVVDTQDGEVLVAVDEVWRGRDVATVVEEGRSPVSRPRNPSACPRVLVP